MSAVAKRAFPVFHHQLFTNEWEDVDDLNTFGEDPGPGHLNWLPGFHTTSGHVSAKLHVMQDDEKVSCGVLVAESYVAEQYLTTELINIILDGEVRITYLDEGKEVIVKAGDIIHSPKNTRMRFEVISPFFREFYFAFNDGELTDHAKNPALQAFLASSKG